MSKTKKIIFWSIAVIIAISAAIYLLIYINIPVAYNNNNYGSNNYGSETEGEGVVLITDKTEYEKGEEIKITIKNNAESQIEYWVIGIGQEEHREDANIWNDIRFDIECPCMAKCEKTPIYLDPGEGSEFIWDQKGDDCQQVGSGKYKARVDWLNPTKEYSSGENPASISNEFIIK